MRLRPEIRPQVEALANLMMWANNQRNSLARQDSMYGHCEKALHDIIALEFGVAIDNRIRCSRNHWNFGGNESYIVDVEVAIEKAIEEVDREVQEAYEILLENSLIEE